MSTTDLIGAILLVLCGPGAVYIVVRALPLSGTVRWGLAAVLTAWFASVVTGRGFGLVSIPGAPTSILFPIALAMGVWAVSPVARRALAQASVALLVGLHVSRVAGGFFIILHAEGRLADPFATVAGYGDLLAALTAIPAAVIAARQRAGWERWVLTWNVVGFLDFVPAVFLGVTSAPGSPLQLFFDPPGTSLLGAFPWRLIPGYFVPLFLIIHVGLFIRLLPIVFSRSGAPHDTELHQRTQSSNKALSALTTKVSGK